MGRVFAVTCCKLKAYSASAPCGAKAFQLSGSSLRGFASHAMKPTQNRTDSTNGSLMVPIQTKPRSVERYLVLPLPVQTCATSPMGSRWARPASVAGSDTAENVQANQASAPEEETFQVTLLSINGEQHAAGHQLSHARFYVFNIFQQGVMVCLMKAHKNRIYKSYTNSPTTSRMTPNCRMVVSFNPHLPRDLFNDLGGKRKNTASKVVFVSASQSVHDLQKLAASELNWNHPWTLSFAHGCTAIECNQREKSLGAMGLVEDCELMVLKRDPWRISTVGQSCYNSEYLCKVIELREVGPHALELDFSAFGDNSLGPLQKAERSVLIWECPNPRSLRDPIEDVTFFAGEPHRFKKARSRVHFTVDSDVHKEGTMTFTDVPTRGKVSFIFGESGYSKLDIDIGPEVMT